jgi:methylated-DNA-protein-cysteine methyltransferase related protein
MPDSFTARVVQALKSVPEGKVVTYGQIAAMAGNPQAARQVVRVLCSMSEREGLPWHRVINSKGGISLTGAGRKTQIGLLRKEGVRLEANGRRNLQRYQWQP